MSTKEIPLNQVILSRVLKACNARGVSIRKAQRECGLSKTTVYRWDKCMPTADRLLKIARYLNVSLDYLTGHTSEASVVKWQELPVDLQTVDVEILRLVNDMVKKGVPLEDIKEVLEITQNINNIE